MYLSRSAIYGRPHIILFSLFGYIYFNSYKEVLIMKKFTKEKKLVVFLLLIITILTCTDIYSLYELNSGNNQIIELK